MGELVVGGTIANGQHVVVSEVVVCTTQDTGVEIYYPVRDADSSQVFHHKGR